MLFGNQLLTHALLCVDKNDEPKKNVNTMISLTWQREAAVSGNTKKDVHSLIVVRVAVRAKRSENVPRKLLNMNYMDPICHMARNKE